MRRPALLAAAIALAALGGCGGADQPELNNEALGETIANLAEEHPAEARTGPPAPALVEIRRDEVERELRPGAGCDFSENGRLLFVAIAGDAFARINGIAVHLAPSGPMGPTGGFFQTERFSISVGRLTDAGVTVDEATSWPARLTVTDRRAETGRVIRLEGAWRCGA